ncbi:hypothetical protein FDP41_000936 [Naegleria fowleri]|uniref:Uncharacterized protein n=1 Tax=Naegleria fowleri TaxID=5763 RepID=A0A6A5BP38_NAEFO|nr:uncharacterized protein FDP41_000936 [Naegleria fowleri]KAF0979783.1 hypothetical protein FDP41_000936 [Naegleria fowleri]
MFQELMFGESSSPMMTTSEDMMTPGKDSGPTMNRNSRNGKHMNLYTNNFNKQLIKNNTPPTLNRPNHNEDDDEQDIQDTPLRDENPSSSPSSSSEVSNSLLHLGKHHHTYLLTPSPISSLIAGGGGLSPRVPPSTTTSSSSLMVLQTPQANDPKRLKMHPTIDIQIINQKLEIVKEEIRKEVEKRLEQMKKEYQNELHAIREQFLRNEQELERERFEKMELKSKLEALEQQFKLLTSEGETQSQDQTPPHDFTRHDIQYLHETPLIPIQNYHEADYDQDSGKEHDSHSNRQQCVYPKSSSPSQSLQDIDQHSFPRNNQLHDVNTCKTSTNTLNVDQSITKPIGPRIRAQDLNTLPQNTFPIESCKITTNTRNEESTNCSQEKSPQSHEQKISPSQQPSNKQKEFKEVKGIYQYTTILQNFHLRKGEEHVPKKKKNSSNHSGNNTLRKDGTRKSQPSTPQLSLKERVTAWHASEKEKEEKFFKQKELLDIYFSSKMKGTPSCERLKNVVIHTYDMWNNLFISYNERERFLDEHVLRPISLAGKKSDNSRWILTDEYISSMLSAFLNEYNKLASYFQQHGHLFKLINERERMKARMDHLWHQTDGILSTKEYMDLGSRLKKLNHDLMKTLSDYEKTNANPFLFRGFRYLDLIQHDQLVQQEEIEEMEKKALQNRIKRSIQ